MTRYIRLPNTNYYDEYKKAYDDLEIGKTKTVLFAEEVGKQKAKALRQRWAGIAKRPLTTNEIKILVRLMEKPRSDLHIRQDGTLYRRTMEDGKDMFHAPINGRIE